MKKEKPAISQISRPAARNGMGTQMGIEIPFAREQNKQVGNGGEGQAVFYRILKLTPDLPVLACLRQGGVGGCMVDLHASRAAGVFLRGPALLRQLATANTLAHGVKLAIANETTLEAVPETQHSRAARAKSRSGGSLLGSIAESQVLGCSPGTCLARGGPLWRPWTNRGESGEGMKHRRALARLTTQCALLVIGQWDPPSTRQTPVGGQRQAPALHLPFWRG
ncbi:hypothetical protein B0T25DRAFT_558542 [Lasiosphaeria hispida]|uniref:Uncharacterized protein n=1 Tax=Lasiosphaeria hispida TaxID=260671 RepID=A0AAJ0H6G2_9PEZI|nr:hypothetical protein B0T25DRAFT_558542 [Lasiosphaeria hispida]